LSNKKTSNDPEGESFDASEGGDEDRLRLPEMSGALLVILPKLNGHPFCT
jgi:hypothetical protein